MINNIAKGLLSLRALALPPGLSSAGNRQLQVFMDMDFIGFYV